MIEQYSTYIPGPRKSKKQEIRCRWCGQSCYNLVKKTSDGWGYWVGLSQPSTAVLKAAGLSAEDASNGTLFHSLMAERKKECRWMFVLEWGTELVCMLAPGGVVVGCRCPVNHHYFVHKVVLVDGSSVLLELKIQFGKKMVVFLRASGTLSSLPQRCLKVGVGWLSLLLQSLDWLFQFCADCLS